MGGGCQAVTQVDQCSLEQYYVRSSMLRALIYNQVCSPTTHPQMRAKFMPKGFLGVYFAKRLHVCVCMPLRADAR